MLEFFILYFLINILLYYIRGEIIEMKNVKMISVIFLRNISGFPFDY